MVFCVTAQMVPVEAKRRVVRIVLELPAGADDRRRAGWEKGAIGDFGFLTRTLGSLKARNSSTTIQITSVTDI